MYTLRGTSSASDISWIGSLQVSTTRDLSEIIYERLYTHIAMSHVLGRIARWTAIRQGLFLLHKCYRKRFLSFQVIPCFKIDVYPLVLNSLDGSFFMLSLADPSKYWQLILAQGVGMGIGQGLLLVPAYTIQAHHWNKRRSMAMGIVSTGTVLVISAMRLDLTFFPL